MEKKTICLSMIVKDEAAVICRCLGSLKSIIDYWVIVDTGSTDGTQEVIKEFMKDVPGELHESLWKDFATNRTEALQLARDKADYTLIMDADDELEVLSDPRDNLTEDSYHVLIKYNSIIYQRVQLIANKNEWYYRGVVHEFLECKEKNVTNGFIGNIIIKINHDGSRHNDGTVYRRDAEIIAKALELETDEFMRSRYTFYLAQSYRDCGDFEKAIEYYLKRADLGFWNQEIYVALCEAAQYRAALNKPDAVVILTYQRAINVCPTRAEAYHGLSNFYRLKNRYVEGYDIAKQGLGLKAPQDGLFTKPWIYEYGLLDEYSINAYWAGHYKDSLSACLQILELKNVPGRDRIYKNAEFAAGKLKEQVAELQGLLDKFSGITL